MTSSSHHPHPGSHRKTSSQKQNISNGPTSSSSSKNYYIRLSYANKKNRSHFLWKKKTANPYPTSNCFALSYQKGCSCSSWSQDCQMFFVVLLGLVCYCCLNQINTNQLFFVCCRLLFISTLFPMIHLWMSPLPFPPAKGAHWSPGAARGLIEKLPSFSMQ